MTTFSVLFPAFSDALREPDPEFAREAQALDDLGIPWRVVHVAALIRGDLAAALRFFGSSPTPRAPMIYRGWILHPGEYAALSEALQPRGVRLLTSPEAYRRGLLFPEFYPVIADHSLPAVWIEGHDPGRAMAAARRLGTAPPYFIKDFAKSAKEIWPEGCVVENEQAMAPAIQALMAYRGERFEGGVVIRPLVRLRHLGQDPFGRDVHEEYRLFFFLGALISCSAYDRVGGDPSELPDYTFLPTRLECPFFTADVVITADGKPHLLEVGDGGSSALPPEVAATDFYTAVSHRMDAVHGAKVAPVRSTP